VPNSILRVGLTGNIASGKSTVAGWLTELGCRTLDLDALAHASMQPGEAGHDAVIAGFGREISRDDGTIDRSALGAIVFADAAARRRLEEILHPLVRQREAELVASIASSHGAGIVVTEAALLYETGAADRYHRMVVVTAPEEVRRRRLEARGLSAAEAGRRMASQMPQEEKARKADYVLENDASLEEVQRKVRILAGLLRRDLVKHMAGEPLEPAARLIA
jgi:dephospho-CoA kinase